eukprot:scaffold17153_cov68-Skeletonema_dohrnii-CCMP3373.AAC.1
MCLYCCIEIANRDRLKRRFPTVSKVALCFAFLDTAFDLKAAVGYLLSLFNRDDSVQKSSNEGIYKPNR